MSSNRPNSAGTRGTAPRAQLPFLDRLLNADPASPEPPLPTPAEALERLHAAVARDLEALLNARRRRVPLPPLLTELPRSILNYGIPDPASGSYAVPDRRAELAQEIEDTVRRFEPRLRRINVELVEQGDDIGGMLKLKVDAELLADPTIEPVSFETLLEPVSRDVKVRET